MRSFAVSISVSLTISLLSLAAAAQITSAPTAIVQTEGPQSSSTMLEDSSPKLVLTDGTPIRLRTSRTVSSTDARAGDLVNLEVLDEVRVDDTVVIPKGGAGLAIVTTAEPRKTMGRGGKLDISIDSVNLANGKKTALRALKQSSGTGNQNSIFAAMAATSVSSAPLIFLRGKEITVPQGTEFIAYVNGNVPLDLASFQPETLRAKTVATTLANSASEIYFSSFPAAAEIQIDGKYIGTTPAAVIVRAGEHKMAVRLYGFKTWRQTMTAAGEKVAFKIRLQPDGSTGSTVSNCSGADCMDTPLGDIVKQKREDENSR